MEKMDKSRDLPRGLEGLRKLAGDIRADTRLWLRLRDGTESDWGVRIDKEGRLNDTLSRLADEIESERPALTDAERRVLELWPRFENREPVMPGDEFIGHWNNQQAVNSVDVGRLFVTLHTENGDWLKYDVGERVERPEPEVLDAVGVPLEVGQTVWHEDGTELMVLGFEHEEDGERIVRVEYVDGPTDWAEVRSLSLTHTSPDSWERLEKDALEFARDNQLPHDVDQMERDALDLIRRAKALAGVER